MNAMDESAPPTGTILVVDDDAAVLGLYASCLQRAGFHVTTAGDGAQAFRTVGRDRFDAILSDINMPGLDGFQLLRAVRERDLDVPVVLMTGDPTVQGAIRALEYGALRYLSKPLLPTIIIKAVDHAVKMHRLAEVKREALDLLGVHGRQLGDRAALEVTFESALSRLWIAYQPIVNWKAQRIYGYEALVRSDNQRLCTPELLLDAAERLGRLSDLGQSIRSRISTDLKCHAVDAKIFVKLHPHDLADDRLFEAGEPLLSHSRRIVFEVTERASLSGLGDVRSRIETLRAKGFEIALDDLGAGYAGLSTFAMLEPDLIRSTCRLRGTFTRIVPNSGLWNRCSISDGSSESRWSWSKGSKPKKNATHSSRSAPTCCRGTCLPGLLRRSCSRSRCKTQASARHTDLGTDARQRPNGQYWLARSVGDRPATPTTRQACHQHLPA